MAARYRILVLFYTVHSPHNFLLLLILLDLY